MKKINNKFASFLAFGLVCVGLQSCVPAKKFEDIQKREQTCLDENNKLRSENESLKTENTEMKASGAEMQKDIVQLVKDTTDMGNAYHRLTSLYGELNKSYDKLLFNNEKLLAGNTEETRKLIAELSATRDELLRREERIKKDSLALNEREKNMADLRVGIKEKQDRVDELEAILNRTDSAVNSLKKAVSDALLGYENNGLSVYRKNGQVYVSMEERLLFASGSTNVEKAGSDALKELAKLLGTKKDISIVVEGHTDNVPINGTLASGAKDNWELSVLRATAVAKILLKDPAIDPTRIVASGKGSYFPIDPANTSEARKKNRRTEIILSPKLDELMKVLGIQDK
ncbi:MAG: OmpA family protein [Bacteroidia bacterium]|nr:OmpA family protein [Bacteroidia bacterium]